MKNKITIRKMGHYLRAYEDGGHLATLDLSTGKIWGATRAWQKIWEVSQYYYQRGRDDKILP
jgi:hypothetical protein